MLRQRVNLEVGEVEKIKDNVARVKMEGPMNVTAEKPAPARKRIAKPRWFWCGVELLSAGLLWEFFWASLPIVKGWTPERSLNWAQAYTRLYSEIYVAMTIALPIMILGAYCCVYGLARSYLAKRFWTWTGAVFICAGVASHSGMAVLFLSAIMEPKWNFMLPILLVSSLTFIVPGAYYLRLRRAISGMPVSMIDEKAKEERDLTRPVWFWVGLVVFIMALGGSCATLLDNIGTQGQSRTLSLVCIFGLAAFLLSIPLFQISCRSLFHGWFWPGIVIFAIGIGAIPEGINMYLNVGRYPAWPAPHDISDLAVYIGLSVLFVIVGAFCLWKGWPRFGVKHSLVERLAFFLTSITICVAWSLVLAVGVS